MSQAGEKTDDGQVLWDEYRDRCLKVAKPETLPHHQLRAHILIEERVGTPVAMTMAIARRQ